MTTGVEGPLKRELLHRASWSLFLRYLTLVTEKMIPLFALRSLSTIYAVLGDRTDHNGLETRPIDVGAVWVADYLGT